MTYIHTVLVVSHIAIGSVALVLFWVPVLARKGGPLHVRVGKIYVMAMYAVAVSAFLASIIALIDPVGIRRPGETFDVADAAVLAARYRTFSLFLLMLSVLVYSALRHGLAALAARQNPNAMKHITHKATIASLAVLALAVGVFGLMEMQLLPIIFAAISLLAAFNMMRDVQKIAHTRKELVIAHLNGLIGSGIGAYTAFFAFGGARFLGEWLPGQWQVLPWVLPTIIGTAAIYRLSKRYQPKPVAMKGSAG